MTIFPTRLRLLALALFIAAACSSESTAPSNSPVRLTAVQGADQFVEVGGTAARPLAVQATDPTSGRTISDVTVSWRLIDGGSTASASPSASATDETGVAATSARAGATAGIYRFEATAARMIGSPPIFTLRAITAPVLSSLSSTTISGGQTIAITGTGFVGTAAEHRAVFGGLRGTVLDVTPTLITARAPDCLLDRSTDVRVLLGDVQSNALQVQTEAGNVTPLSVSPGNRVTVADPAELACVAIENVPDNSRFLLVLQNAARSPSVAMQSELTLIAGNAAPVPFTLRTPEAHADAASRFELGLRRAERLFGPASAEPGGLDAVASADPEVGDAREFNVLTPDNGTRRIRATVQLVSQRAVLYVDDDAPAGGLTTADLGYFGELFDDPIYATDTAAFGQPSDIDGNGRIVILFTPAVNRLTDDDSGGFIAGYFYGCDLVSASRCSATNRGEIFYSMVPDPTGQFGGTRSRDVVRRTVPAVLAHEFQHMINFSRKNDRLDVLWLSEGLAHAAEDLVGQALEDRGDIAAAADFRRPNHARAQIYLSSTRSTPLVAEDSPGTLAQRGGAWLLVKYITGHYGGVSLLSRLTSSEETGAANIEQATGQSWSSVFAGFTTALWADGAPGLDGPAAATNQFADFELRDVIASLGSPFPLVPPALDFQDLILSLTLPAGSVNHLLIDVPSASAMLRLGFTGVRAGPFESTTRPQLTVFRVR